MIGEMPDRTAKFQAPQFREPTGRWTPAEALKRLAATLPPTAPLMIWMMRLMTSPDMTQHSPGPVSSCSLARRRTIAVPGVDPKRRNEERHAAGAKWLTK